MIASSEFYVDESGTHKSSHALCVAGFVFKKEAALALSKEWQGVLDCYEVPFFHMGPSVHGKKPFDHLSEDRRLDMRKELIKIIRKHMTFGFAVSVVEKDYYEIVPNTPQVGSAYTYLLRQCLSCVATPRSGAQLVNEKVSYIFESGADHEGEAKRIVQELMDEAEATREKYHYVSHDFADKKKTLPLQAADLLAWLWHNQAKRGFAGSNILREDLRALMQERHFFVLHFTPNRLREFVAVMERFGVPIGDPPPAGSRAA